VQAVAAPVSKVAEPAPQPVAMAVAAPKPVAVAYVAPVRAAERLTVSADTLFDFNKSELRPLGRMKLDEFIAKTKGIDPETISVVGHTNRICSESYNQILSEQRATFVKNYLISKGIDPTCIQAEGKGESQLVKLAGTCSGAKSARVIACLQPDRNVEIEVEGASIAYK
jgi:OOP family OmpA-OmpF porin